MSAAPVIGIRKQGVLDLVQSLLHRGAAVRIRVSGGSMQPFLNGGEIVEIVPLGVRQPRIGDILLFRDQRGNPLLHRFVRQRLYNGQLHFQTKGDACACLDSPVPADQVLGYVRRVIFTDRTVDLRTSLMRLTAYGISARTVLVYLLQRAGLSNRPSRRTGSCRTDKAGSSDRRLSIDGR